MGHSVSPAMHNAAFKHMGLDITYKAMLVTSEGLSDATAWTKGPAVLGLNVTVPHKEAIIGLLDRVDPEARAIGAVNTVVNRGGRLEGYNTDGRGFIKGLRADGVAVAGTRVLVLGAGGAARAVCYYLAREAGELCIYNRTPERARRLAAEFGGEGRTVSAIERLEGFLKGFDIVINATSLGLGADDPLPCDLKDIRPGQTVCDLIYRTTPFLREAAARGAATVDGTGMLLYQGVLSLELWTGEKAPVGVMKEALKRALK